MHYRQTLLTSYAQLIQGSKPLKLTLPKGNTMVSDLTSASLFFHNGLIGSMAPDRNATCREGMVNEIRRRHNLGYNLSQGTVSVIRARGGMPKYVKTNQLKNFIRAFVDKRENRAEFMHSLTSIKKIKTPKARGGEEWSITFPISDTYYGDAYTSASMLIWLLRNPQYIFNDKDNFDNLLEVLRRLQKTYLNTSGMAASTQNLLLWLSLYVASDNGNVVMQYENNENPTRGPNGPVNFIGQLDLNQTMTAILFIEKGIDRLYKITNEFSKDLYGRLGCYADLLGYEKYLQAHNKKGA
ncbi:MAG: hypothetical protein ACW99Q_20545 [Candidatus Kariarchaeaceae archaeon]